MEPLSDKDSNGGFLFSEQRDHELELGKCDVSLMMKRLTMVPLLESILPKAGDKVIQVDFF